MFKTIKLGPVYITVSLLPPVSQEILASVRQYSDVMAKAATGWERRFLDAKNEAVAARQWGEDQIRQISQRLDAAYSEVTNQKFYVSEWQGKAADLTVLVSDLRLAVTNLPSLITNGGTIPREQVAEKAHDIGVLLVRATDALKDGAANFPVPGSASFSVGTQVGGVLLQFLPVSKQADLIADALAEPTPSALVEQAKQSDTLAPSEWEAVPGEPDAVVKRISPYLSRPNPNESKGMA